ncbi:MAG: hypothetical protein SGJ04_05550 [Bacteroidota bacterium]|nr:hypothetical protein [Bacteroidota bacterium]
MSLKVTDFWLRRKLSKTAVDDDGFDAMWENIAQGVSSYKRPWYHKRNTVPAVIFMCMTLVLSYMQSEVSNKDELQTYHIEKFAEKSKLEGHILGEKFGKLADKYVPGISKKLTKKGLISPTIKQNYPDKLIDDNYNSSNYELEYISLTQSKSKTLKSTNYNTIKQDIHIAENNRVDETMIIRIGNELAAIDSYNPGINNSKSIVGGQMTRVKKITNTGNYRKESINGLNRQLFNVYNPINMSAAGLGSAKAGITYLNNIDLVEYANNAESVNTVIAEAKIPKTPIFIAYAHSTIKKSPTVQNNNTIALGSRLACVSGISLNAGASYTFKNKNYILQETNYGDQYSQLGYLVNNKSIDPAIRSNIKTADYSTGLFISHHRFSIGANATNFLKLNQSKRKKEDLSPALYRVLANCIQPINNKVAVMIVTDYTHTSQNESIGTGLYCSYFGKATLGVNYTNQFTRYSNDGGIVNFIAGYNFKKHYSVNASYGTNATINSYEGLNQNLISFGIRAIW